MGIETRGTIYKVFETKQVSERFTKREFVLTIDPGSKYPQTVLFQLTGDRCSQLDGFNEGDEVSIEYSLRGREWSSPKGETKYFNTLDVWKVTPVGERRQAPPPSSREVTAPPADDDPDSIPF